MAPIIRPDILPKPTWFEELHAAHARLMRIKLFQDALLDQGMNLKKPKV